MGQNNAEISEQIGPCGFLKTNVGFTLIRGKMMENLGVLSDK